MNYKVVLVAVSLLALASSFLIAPHSLEAKSAGQWSNPASGEPFWVFISSAYPTKVVDRLTQLMKDATNLYVSVSKEVGSDFTYDKVPPALVHLGLKNVTTPFETNFTFTSFNTIDSPEGVALDLSYVMTPQNCQYKQEFYPVFSKWLYATIVMPIQAGSSFKANILISWVFKTSSPNSAVYKTLFTFYQVSYEKQSTQGGVKLAVRMAELQKQS